MLFGQQGFHVSNIPAKKIKSVIIQFGPLMPT